MSVSPDPLLAVVVIDADPLARGAIVNRLAADPGLELRGAFADIGAAVRALADATPDVVVLAVRTGSGDGVSALEEVRRADTQAAILLLASADDPDLGLRALRAGASGFLPKSIALDPLPRILKSMARGETVLTRAMTTALVERLRQTPVDARGLRPVRSTLSTREWEVLDLICEGASTPRIAEELGMSIETVRSHVKRILRKLGAHSRSEAAERAREMLAATTGAV